MGFLAPEGSTSTLRNFYLIFSLVTVPFAHATTFVSSFLCPAI